MTKSEKIRATKNDKKYGKDGWHYAEDCFDGECTLEHEHGINCLCADCCAEFD